jgi:hypothetical protein
MDLVFDKSGLSVNGVPALLYSRDSYDFTNDVVAALNKPGRISQVSTEGASTGAPTVTTKASPAATPKKP